MNRFTIGTVVLLSSCLCVMNARSQSAEVDKARQYGAQGQVTLRVIDSTAKPVELANVSAGFYNPHERGQVAEGKTDTNGCFVATGRPVDDMRYTIMKDSYYKTEGTYAFHRPGADSSVKDGRWQPWNLTNTVVLKERRNPVPMCAKSVDESVPIRDAPVGFDLEKGDWVAPHGKGTKTDLVFTYQAQIKDYWTGKKELVITCTNRLDGFYRAQKDMWSDLQSTYEAVPDDYQASVRLVLDATKQKVLESQGIGRSEYLVCRVRTVLDDKGNIVSAHYGKIYGPIEYGAGKNLDRLRFVYYLNPTANDRNLEFDPSWNLLGATDKRRVYQP
jgi:hypothetical protein